MVLQGRVTIENTSAIQTADGVTTSHGKPPIRFGDTVVPASVAYVVQGDLGSPSLRIEFEIREGKPVCTGIHVTAGDEGRGIATGDIATLPNLTRLAEESFLALALHVDEKLSNWQIDPGDRARVRLARQEIHTRGDEELREVAQVYRDNLADRPVEAVQAMGYSRRTASRRVEQAREKGFLPKTTRGKKNA